MILSTNHSEFYNDLSESIRAFFPDANVVLADNADITHADAETVLTVEAYIKGETAYANARLNNGADAADAADTPVGHAELACGQGSALHVKRVLKRVSKLAVYRLLSHIENKALPWGSLTGIRPTKLIYGGTDSEELEKVYGVSADKCRLLEEIISAQKPFIHPPQRSIDVYIGIPFCRTRCVYCSFATHDATKHKLIPAYMDALERDIAAAGDMLKAKGLRPRCLYIGGGTPTALDERQFAHLLEALSVFEPEKEYTVEAGRPDTITVEKMRAMKKRGVTRISINPQTMCADTLALIGRRHSPQDIFDCFTQAKDIGFNSINADLIAGLPGENNAIFARSLKSVLELGADNITVHTLSVKNGSVISEYPQKYPMPSQEEAAAMVDTAREMLSRAGYTPYYLYRQKYQAGNLENVGYALDGKQCIYNIDIMEETVSVLALGAGAVSKRVFDGQGRIERCANSKSIYDYIQRIEEMIKRKQQLFDTF